MTKHVMRWDAMKQNEPELKSNEKIQFSSAVSCLVFNNNDNVYLLRAHIHLKKALKAQMYISKKAIKHVKSNQASKNKFK